MSIPQRAKVSIAGYSFVAFLLWPRAYSIPLLYLCQAYMVFRARLPTWPELFLDHSREAFEELLVKAFVVRERVVLGPMGRVLYLAQKR